AEERIVVEPRHEHEDEERPSGDRSRRVGEVDRSHGAGPAVRRNQPAAEGRAGPGPKAVRGEQRQAGKPGARKADRLAPEKNDVAQAAHGGNLREGDQGGGQLAADEGPAGPAQAAGGTSQFPRQIPRTSSLPENAPRSSRRRLSCVATDDRPSPPTESKTALRIPSCRGAAESVMAAGAPVP